ncbi:MAG: (deoxy)nucleoside triphosphate pyrophosphohydrolase [Pseudonocardiaceae bacterium]
MVVVVAAALIRGGRVLAQQRTYPPELAGRWELPGGRVEPGECDRDALVRECHEELGVEVVPGGRLGPEVALPGGAVLRAYVAHLAPPPNNPDNPDDPNNPVPLEHAALRWVGIPALAGLDWLDADRAVLPDLAALLAVQETGADGPRNGPGYR